MGVKTARGAAPRPRLSAIAVLAARRRANELEKRDAIAFLSLLVFVAGIERF
jgi:hypothetical protein